MPPFFFICVRFSFSLYEVALFFVIFKEYGVAVVLCVPLCYFILRLDSALGVLCYSVKFMCFLCLRQDFDEVQEGKPSCKVILTDCTYFITALKSLAVFNSELLRLT